MALYCWPKVFTEPDYDYAQNYSNEKQRRAAALSEGLTGWGICMSGNGGEKLPELFGKAMVKIGQILNISATPDNLMKLEP